MLAIKKKHNVEWEELLFDFDFLKHFGYDHWSELSLQPEQTGFLIDSQNRIEIKMKAKLISRFFSFELLNLETLFPIYDTFNYVMEYQPLTSFKRIIVIQIEKGLVGKYYIETNQFQMNEMKYELVLMQHLKFLRTIVYKHELLTQINDDTVVIGNKVILLN